MTVANILNELYQCEKLKGEYELDPYMEYLGLQLDIKLHQMGVNKLILARKHDLKQIELQVEHDKVMAAKQAKIEDALRLKAIAKKEKELEALKQPA